MNAKKPLMLLLAALLAGCAEKPSPPQTFAVKGRIAYIDGKPFRGGIITFTLQSDPSKTMNGEIADDGRFTVATPFNDQRLPGAVEGVYQVMVSAKFSAAARGVDIYILPQTFKVEPRENEFTIEIDPATARH